MTDFDAIAKGMTQAVPFAGHLGLEITSIAEGEAVVRLPERPELTNHVGSQHAGALFTVAETASGAAFVAAFAERRDPGGRPEVRPEGSDLRPFAPRSRDLESGVRRRQESGRRGVVGDDGIKGSEWPECRDAFNECGFVLGRMLTKPFSDHIFSFCWFIAAAHAYLE